MEKIKQFIKSQEGKDVFLFLIVILVGLSSFELGKIYSKPKGSLSLKYTEIKAQSAQSIKSTDTLKNAQVFLQTNPSLDKSTQVQSKSFFASKRGKKYYSLDCSAGKSIKIENRVYFDTAEKAESAGYEKSASCK